MAESLNLFNDEPLFETMRVVDADIKFMHAFYSRSVADHYFQHLLVETPWRQDTIDVYGKRHLQPRLIAWYGDQGADYSYSGLNMTINTWTPSLLDIKADMERITATSFNSVLINLYRDHRDSVGWHSDDEPELGINPSIASLSFGETRTFKLKHKTHKMIKPLSFELSHGSMLLMAGRTQQCWQHAVLKETNVKGPRINLTFRTIGKASKPRKK